MLNCCLDKKKRKGKKPSENCLKVNFYLYILKTKLSELSVVLISEAETGELS